MAEPDPDTPHRLGDLTRGEHMLLWAFRAEAFGAGHCLLVRRQFEQACGPVGAEALNALVVFVRELARCGKRRIGICMPGSYRLSRDEQLILAVFASAQAEQYDRMAAHLAWLVGADPGPAFPAAACLVADALALNGLILRLPDVDPGAWSTVEPELIEDPSIVLLSPLRGRG